MSNQEDLVDDLVLTAIQWQQKFYELSSDWAIYNDDQLIRLKQNIAFAIFGPPMSDDLPIDKLMNGSELSTYSKEALKTIDTVYTKIVQNGRSANTTHDICCTVIFNIIFCCEKNSKSQDGPSSLLSSIPIFKVYNCSNEAYGVVFVDASGRVYKNWTDYKRNNTLPKCSMILPVEGTYQANPALPCTKDFSTVWLEHLPSPASKVTAKVLKAGDVAAGLIGIGGMGLTMAAMFTPVGAVAGLAGLAACSINGVWTGSRSIKKLVDREKHGESIKITNKEACAEWLGIAGSALGVAASGGTALISRAVTTGTRVTATARIAFNTVTIGNMIVNGAGVGFSTYCMFDNFRKTGKVLPQDMLLLSTHILFFGNAVINAKTARGLIESTQRNYIHEYEQSLRADRLQSEFARLKRQVRANADPIDRNAELIRKINLVRVQDDLIPGMVPQTLRNVASSSVGFASYVIGNVDIRKILLSDPIQFAVKLVKKGIYIDPDEKSWTTTNLSSSSLCRKMLQLLSNYYTSSNCPTTFLPAVTDFYKTLYDMKNVSDSCNTLEKVFLICVSLIASNHLFEKYLVELFKFVWEYAKEKASQFLTPSKSVDDARRDVVMNIFELLDPLVHKLGIEFGQYLSVKFCFAKLRPSCS